MGFCQEQKKKSKIRLKSELIITYWDDSLSSFQKNKHARYLFNFKLTLIKRHSFEFGKIDTTRKPSSGKISPISLKSELNSLVHYKLWIIFKALHVFVVFNVSGKAHPVQRLLHSRERERVSKNLKTIKNRIYVERTCSYMYVSFCGKCVCVCGLVRTYIRGQFCVFKSQNRGRPTSGDVPGPYNTCQSTI